MKTNRNLTSTRNRRTMNLARVAVIQTMSRALPKPTVVNNKSHWMPMEKALVMAQTKK